MVGVHGRLFPLHSYSSLVTRLLVGCSGCDAVARYKVASRWSDGATAELKTYALGCQPCLPVLLARARCAWAACRRAEGETLDLPAVYELGGQVRRTDLEM